MSLYKYYSSFWAQMKRDDSVVFLFCQYKLGGAAEILSTLDTLLNEVSEEVDND